MTKKTGIWIFLFFAIFVSSLCFCVSWGPVFSGGKPPDSGTSTGNAIVGKLYQPCGKRPARGDSVFLRPQNYLPDIRIFQKHDVTLPNIIIFTCTDDSGNYRFQSIPDGVYICEARDSVNNCVMIDPIKIDHSLPAPAILVDTLKPPSTITGKLLLVNDSEKVYFQVFGLDIFAIAAADGTFSLNNLPAGNIQVLISIFRGSNAEIDTTIINIKPGVVIVVDTFALFYDTVAYDGNGNTGGKVPMDNKRYKSGQKALVLGNTGSLEKTGCVFTGWNTQKDGSGNRYNPGDSIIMNSRAMTLFAIWTPNNIVVVTDIDGNGYKTVKIGTQLWMEENLKTTRYNDGVPIPLVADDSAWKFRTTPAYCWYGNNKDTVKSAFGALYNWYAVKTGKLAPRGWHVPTWSEWKILSTFLGNGYSVGGKLKETGTIHWNSPNTDATNESGFSALPGGRRDGGFSFCTINSFAADGLFCCRGFMGEWWSSDTLGSGPVIYYLSYNDNNFFPDGDDRSAGLSIRCVRDTVVNERDSMNTKGLVLWNTLDSKDEITHSKVGANGTYLGGDFQPGKFGNAFQVSYSQDTLVYFPGEVIPVDSGCIEFWAKLSGMPENLEWGNNPSFIICNDDSDQTFVIHLNGNDGVGNGGLCGRAGGRIHVGTGWYGSWKYSDVLDSGKVEQWHHYALVWNVQGIAAIGNVAVFDSFETASSIPSSKLGRCAIYLDGKLNTTRWRDFGGPFKVPENGRLRLMRNMHLTQGTVSIDNLKIWNYSKTDFSDRFTE